MGCQKHICGVLLPVGLAGNSNEAGLKEDAVGPYISLLEGSYRLLSLSLYLHGQAAML